MKANLLTTIALLTTFAVPTLADTAIFPGADATACDAAQFTPVYSDDGATVLYWNNPTCAYAGSGQPNPAVLHPEDEDRGF